MDMQREKTSLDILDSVTSPSPPAFIASTPGATSMEHTASSSPIPPIEIESLASSPRHSSFSNYPPLGQLLTSSASFYDIPLTDAFTELMERYVPPDERPERNGYQQQQQPLIHLDDKPDELVTMVMNNHWQSVARYARQKLVQTPPNDMETIFQLWYLRLLSLYQLDLYQLCSAEFEKLGDWMSHEGIPFELRVLWAILPFQLQHPLVTLERLTGLAIQCQHQQQVQREYQVYLILVTRLIHMNDYHMAANILRSVLNKVTSMDPSAPCRLDLLSSLGRLYLQLGDLTMAETLYSEMETIHQEQVKNNQANPMLQETINVNRAFLCMGKGEYVAAKQLLEQIFQENNENLTAMNNLAVCLVYTGELSKAMGLLEDMTRRHPTSAGTSEVALMNLCTLYELRFDGAGLTNKKVDVVKQIARWVGDSFHPQCIKLQ